MPIFRLWIYPILLGASPPSNPKKWGKRKTKFTIFTKAVKKGGFGVFTARPAIGGMKLGFCSKTSALKQTIKNLFRFEDLNGTRKTIVFAALLLSVIPGLIFILSHLVTGLEGPNPFLMAVVFLFGAPSIGIGLLTYIFADKRLKRKVTYAGLLILFQISILPTIWLTNDIKTRIFLIGHQTELEQIANNILDDKWTLEYATSYTSKRKLPVIPFGYIEEDKTVLFLIGGLIDNCHGLAFSRSGNKAEQNNCGELISWKRIKGTWYKWGTT